jgi:hypothetical protein
MRAFRLPNLIDVAAVAGGFIGGVKATKLITTPQFLATGMGRKFAGLVHVAIGFVLSGMARQPALKKAGMGFAAAGVYDILTQNFAAQLRLMPMSGVDLEMGTDIGPGMEVVGDDLEVVGGADIPSFDDMDVEDMEDAYAI